MGFCPMACASPMLARTTSVKGFLTPWEGKGTGVRTGQVLVLCDYGNGPDAAAQVQPGGQWWGPGPYLAQFLLQLKGAQNDGPAHCVLHPPNTRVHGVQRQHLLLQPVHCNPAVVTCPQGQDTTQTRQEDQDSRIWAGKRRLGPDWMGRGWEEGARAEGLKVKGTLFTAARWPHGKGQKRLKKKSGPLGPAPPVWAQFGPREP